LWGFVRAETWNGLIISAVIFRRSDGSFWAVPAGVPIIGADDRVIRDQKGKAPYQPIVEFISRERSERWSDSVIAALQRDYSSALDDA
jgi:hypothetical protein